MRVFVKVTLIVLAVIVVILVAGVIFLRILFPTPLSKEATEKDFVKNQDSILLVTDYLIRLKDTSVYITDTASKGYAVIEDAQVANAIKKLFSNGYSAIFKSGNTIHFQRSTRFRDFGSGVAYSIDGSKPQLQFLTKLEPLSKLNWYYYEEDFNEYKKLNNRS
ncbi:hypothetical protein AAFA46_05470 [Oscillospiraceae bacterium WX1]